MPADIAWIIYRRRTAAAMEKMNAAANDSSSHIGGGTLESHQQWLAAQARWDKAVDEYDRAEAWYARVVSELGAKP